MSAGRTILAALREAARIPGEARQHRASPPSDGLVVEIGGGQSPHPRTDLVVDRYVVDDFEREGALRAPLSPLFHADFAASTLHRIWWSAHRSRWLHSVEWCERLVVRVVGSSVADATAQLDVPATVAALEAFRPEAC